MGILSDVLEYKKYKDSEQAASLNAIPQAVAAFISGRQQQQKNMLDMLQIDATLATKGLRRTETGFAKDESLLSASDKLAEMGDYAKNVNALREAGMLPPSGGVPSIGGQGGGMLGSGGQLNVPQGGVPSTQVASEPTQEGDAFATQATLNVAGQPTSTTVKSESGMRREIGIKKEESKQSKLGEAEAKIEAAATEQSKAGLRFIQQYERSFDEIQKKVPGFGETGVMGKAKRGGAGVLNALDELPETSTLIDSAEVFANRMVKADEGGKITDKDRAVYGKILVNTLTAPSAKNARLASNELVSLYDRGAGIDDNLIAFSSSKNPTLKTIYSQVVEQVPELKIVRVRDSETGEERTMTLKQANALRGEK